MKTTLNSEDIQKILSYAESLRKKRTYKNYRPANEAWVRQCVERFWSKIDVRSESECWFFKYQTKARPAIGFMGTGMNASRFMLLIQGVDISTDLEACHKCDVPNCVNPAHLFLGTRRENAKDCVWKGRNYVPGLKGKDSPQSKLDDSDIPKILKLRESGVIVPSIAYAFGVTPSCVTAIIKGRTWTHITKPELKDSK